MNKWSKKMGWGVWWRRGIKVEKEKVQKEDWIINVFE